MISPQLTRVAVQAGPRLIAARWWLLTLDCGHQVVRQRKAGVECPRRCHCEICARTRTGE